VVLLEVHRTGGREGGREGGKEHIPVCTALGVPVMVTLQGCSGGSFWLI